MSYLLLILGIALFPEILGILTFLILLTQDFFAAVGGGLVVWLFFTVVRYLVLRKENDL